MMGYNGDFGWWGWLWMLIPGGLWAGLLALTFRGIGALTTRPAPASDRSAALEIARARYARGEITKAQYEELIRNLAYVS